MDDLLARVADMPEHVRDEWWSRISPEDRRVVGRLLKAQAREQEASGSWADPLSMASDLSDGVTERPHLRMIADRAAATCEAGGRLIVSLPPQHGKSQVLSRWLPVWYLRRWPDRHVAVVSYASQLAEDRCREARDTVRQFSDRLGIEVGQPATQKQWDVTAGGGMVAAGIHGMLTGRPVDGLLVVDDPFANWEEAHSKTVREAVWDWWRSVALARIGPYTAVIVVQTRWHEDDLVGRLTSGEWEGDPDEWDVLTIPAIAEDNDPLGRAPGEPLIRPDGDYTADQSREFLATQERSLGPYLWQALFQQKPGSPQGTIFNRDWWKFWHPEKAPHPPLNTLRIVQSWDMSFKDTIDGSWVVGQTWATDGVRWWLLDQWRDRVAFTAAQDAVVAQAGAWPSAATRLVEAKANGPAIIDSLKTKVSRLNPVNVSDSKTTRAWAVQGAVSAGNVFLPSPETCPWVRGFIQEVTDFPNGTHDDQVDAFTQAITHGGTGGPVRGAAPRGAAIPRGPRVGGRRR